jgi:hypothetical protein
MADLFPEVPGIGGPDLDSLFGSAKATITAPTAQAQDTDRTFLDAILSRLPANDGENSTPSQPLQFDYSLHNDPLSPFAFPIPQSTGTGPRASTDIWSMQGVGSGVGVAGQMGSMAQVTPPYGLNNISDASIQSHISPSMLSAAQPPVAAPSLPNHTEEPKRAVQGIPSIEDVTSWANVSFFVSLHIKHQHALVPLVHKPSFADDMLHRRDETDVQFRGLLSSIGEWLLCDVWAGRAVVVVVVVVLTRRSSRLHDLSSPNQPHVPTIHTATPRSVVVPRTKAGQGGAAAQHPSTVPHPARVDHLVSEASLRALTRRDAISSQATNNPVLTDLLMSEARRLIFRLKLNQAMPMEGLNVYEVEVCRRLYWEFWAVEKCAIPTTARDRSH